MKIKSKAHIANLNADLLSKVEDLYEKGLSKGYNTGWHGLDDLITIKQGTTFYVYGSPFSGKTEWWFEVLINLSCNYGLRHVIYSPETGSPQNIFGELISKLCRKPFFRNVEDSISKEDLYKNFNWLDEHFKIIEDPNGDMNLKEFFDIVDDYEDSFGKIHTTTIDPFNELNNDLTSQRDLGLEKLLGHVRRDAIIKNRVNCIITHVTDQELKQENGISFYPSPTPRQIAYGQAWYRKGMNMIGVWRPPFGLMDAEGRPFEKNEVHIDIQKFKPKGVGNRGKHIMFYDIKKNSYYEKPTTLHNDMNNKYSIRDKTMYSIKQDNNIKINEDDLPF